MIHRTKGDGHDDLGVALDASQFPGRTLLLESNLADGTVTVLQARILLGYVHLLEEAGQVGWLKTQKFGRTDTASAGALKRLSNNPMFMPIN